MHASAHITKAEPPVQIPATLRLSKKPRRESWNHFLRRRVRRRKYRSARKRAKGAPRPRALQRAAAFSNESPVKRVSFESLSKILFWQAQSRRFKSRRLCRIALEITAEDQPCTFLQKRLSMAATSARVAGLCGFRCFAGSPCRIALSTHQLIALSA